MNLLKLTLVGCLGTIAAVACSTTSSSSREHSDCNCSSVGVDGGCINTACKARSAGTSSNWLAVCSQDSDCPGLECWCGICTKPCKAASECSGFSEGASCDATLATAICGAPTFDAACALVCTENSDCTALGPEGQCIEGACRKVTGATLSDAGALTCPVLNASIQKSYGDVLAAAAAAAPCSNDADCVAAPVPRCGFWSCAAEYASNAGVGIVQAKLPEIERGFCDSYFSAGCSQPGGFLGCPALEPVLCIQGSCTACTLGICPSQPADAGAGGTRRPPPTCEDRTQEISDYIQSNIALKDDSCASDADCTTVAIDMRCHHACSSPPLSVAAAEVVASALKGLEGNLCPAFETAGCTSPVPPCPPQMPTRCVTNRCVAVRR